MVVTLVGTFLFKVKVVVPAARVIFSLNKAITGLTLIDIELPPSAENVIGVIELFAQTSSVKSPVVLSTFDG